MTAVTGYEQRVVDTILALLSGCRPRPRGQRGSAIRAAEGAASWSSARWTSQGWVVGNVGRTGISPSDARPVAWCPDAMRSCRARGWTSTEPPRHRAGRSRGPLDPPDPRARHHPRAVHLGQRLRRSRRHHGGRGRATRGVGCSPSLRSPSAPTATAPTCSRHRLPVAARHARRCSTPLARSRAPARSWDSWSSRSSASAASRPSRIERDRSPKPSWWMPPEHRSVRGCMRHPPPSAR